MTHGGMARCPRSRPWAPLAAVVEGPWDSIRLGDALARAQSGCSTPTGTRQMDIPPVNRHLLYASLGLRLVFLGVMRLTQARWAWVSPHPMPRNNPSATSSDGAWPTDWPSSWPPTD